MLHNGDQTGVFQSFCFVLIIYSPIIHQPDHCETWFSGEAGQLGLIPTRPVSQLGLGLTRPGQLGLLFFFSITGGVFYKCMMLLDMNYHFMC